MKKFVLRLAAISVRDYDVLLAPFWPLFGGFNASDGGRPVICDRRGREAETPSPVRVRGRAPVPDIKTLRAIARDEKTLLSDKGIRRCHDLTVEGGKIRLKVRMFWCHNDSLKIRSSITF